MPGKTLPFAPLCCEHQDKKGAVRQMTTAIRFKRLVSGAAEAVAAAALSLGLLGPAFAGVIPIIIDDDAIFLPCGDITGNTGAPGVTVTAGGRSTVSDPNGNYALRCLPSGDVIVSVSKSGLQFAPGQKVVAVGSEAQVVNFQLAQAIDPVQPSFWGPPPPAGLTTRDQFLDFMFARACAQGFYPDFTCPAAAARAASATAPGNKIGPLDHDLNGCSALDGLPRVGPYFRAGGGVFEGVDNLWFKRSCNNHDQCYQHGFDQPAWGNQAWGGTGTIGECNEAFRLDNIATCNASAMTKAVAAARTFCLDFANLYFGAVAAFGASSYHASASLSALGRPVPCSPKIDRASTTGVLGTTMVVHAPLAAVDTNCLLAPTDLGIAGTTSTSISLLWSEAKGAIGYNVFRSEPKDTRPLLVNAAPITKTSFTDTGLGTGSTYTYQVRAVYSGGQESGPSASVTASTSRPAGVSVRACPSSRLITDVGGSERFFDLNTGSGTVTLKVNVTTIQFVGPETAHVRITSLNAAKTVLLDTTATSGTGIGSYFITRTFSYNFAALNSRYIRLTIDRASMEISCPQ